MTKHLLKETGGPTDLQYLGVLYVQKCGGQSVLIKSHFALNNGFATHQDRSTHIVDKLSLTTFLVHTYAYAYLTMVIMQHVIKALNEVDKNVEG